MNLLLLNIQVRLQKIHQNNVSVDTNIKTDESVKEFLSLEDFEKTIKAKRGRKHKRLDKTTEELTDKIMKQLNKKFTEIESQLKK